MTATWAQQINIYLDKRNDRNDRQRDAGRDSYQVGLHMIAQEENHAHVAEASAPGLTPLEQQILEYVWRGYSTGMIAAALGKSPRTIETYREIR